MHHLTCAVREINARLAEDVRVTLRSASVQKTFVYSVRWSHEELEIKYWNPFLGQSNPKVRRMCLGLRASSSRHAELEPFTVTVCVCAWGRETECVCHKGWGICVSARARADATFIHSTMTHWQASIRSESQMLAHDVFFYSAFIN